MASRGTHHEPRHSAAGRLRGRAFEEGAAAFAKRHAARGIIDSVHRRVHFLFMKSRSRSRQPQPGDAASVVRRAIRESPFSLAELGRRTGVNQQAISNFAHGHFGMLLATFEKLRHELGLEVTRTDDTKGSLDPRIRRRLSKLLREVSGFVGGQGGIDYVSFEKLCRDVGLRITRIDGRGGRVAASRHAGRRPEPSREIQPDSASIIRRAILESGLSRVELERRTGVDLVVISRFLKDGGDIRLATFQMLSGVLGLKITRVGNPQATVDPRLHKHVAGLLRHVSRVVDGQGGISHMGFAKLCRKLGLRVTRTSVERSAAHRRTEHTQRLLRRIRGRDGASVVKRAILESGLSFTELERRTGITPTTFSRFVEGRGGIKLSTFQALSGLLGLTITPTRQHRRQA
jgi:transcriptional regulator with XRE-family HTH domain